MRLNAKKLASAHSIRIFASFLNQNQKKWAKFKNVMPTYIYETIPKNSKEKPTRFELRQSIKDTPISEHPDTGQKVRRVISGGISISPKKGSSKQNSSCCSSASGSDLNNPAHVARIKLVAKSDVNLLKSSRR